MIFDLLTLKDPFSRIKIYPNENNTPIFYIEDKNDHNDIASYVIEEGYYFEVVSIGSYKLLTEVHWDDLIDLGYGYLNLHAIKVTYRASVDIDIDISSVGKYTLPACENMQTVSVLLNLMLHGHSIDIRVHDNTVQRGEYAIIKNFEFLTL